MRNNTLESVWGVLFPFSKGNMRVQEYYCFSKLIDKKTNVAGLRHLFG